MSAPKTCDDCGRAATADEPLVHVQPIAHIDSHGGWVSAEGWICQVCHYNEVMDYDAWASERDLEDTYTMG